MASTDDGALDTLLEETKAPTPGLQDLLQTLAALRDGTPPELRPEEAGGPPEMELQTFEHYDYVVFLFKDVLDWRSAQELLGLEKQAFTLRDGKTRKIGLGRVIDGKRLLELLKRKS
jgi:hypothetical protein